MPISFPRSLVEHLLLGPEGDRRQLQDSPVLGDVWIAFAAEPHLAQELLLTPYKEHGSSSVAVAVDGRIARDRKNRDRRQKADIAYLQGIVAATVNFDELLRVIVPLTSWWGKEWTDENRTRYLDYWPEESLMMIILTASQMLARWGTSSRRPNRVENTISALDRYVVLSAIILWGMTAQADSDPATMDDKSYADLIKENADDIASGMLQLLRAASAPSHKKEDVRPSPLIYQISLNREVSMALTRSVPAVKADAARNLFKVDCSNIAWAVIDTGVQGRHPCFVNPDTQVSRVKASFDFSNYRRIVSLDNQRIFARGGDAVEQAERLEELIGRDDLLNKPTDLEAKKLLRRLALDLENKRPVHWEFVRPFVEIDV
ncbi:MAG: hypothetical protein KGI75_09750, partial [Rhizobiaceae bacterium]|nr:hypothetical protein [Rhizobiaceae bacterium]